jgi:luciferase family oxidoreductase group 1
MKPLSILDLAPIPQGSDATEALRRSLELAQHAEKWGYRRFWVAEHHNMPGIASSATAVLIGFLAGGTKTIRVGSGGVMLPNHPPLVIAEQFGTLETLYPGRIDLGLGRAPGTDPLTTRALRRDNANLAERFPQDVIELRDYFRPPAPARVHAIPGEGLDIPIWLLGSSDFSARLAAALGMPFAFASHFAPAQLHSSLALYREGFQPSEQLDRPHVMVAVNVVAAETDQEARRLFTSLQLRFTELQRGGSTQLAPPIDTMEGLWTEAERAWVERSLSCSVVGSPEAVRNGLERLLRATEADELILNGPIYDHDARLRSFEIAAEVAGAERG